MDNNKNMNNIFNLIKSLFLKPISSIVTAEYWFRGEIK